MSKINLQTSDDIISFLQILAEESVDAAKKTLSSDSLQSSISSKMKSDEKLYGSLEEQPEEEEEQGEKIDIDTSTQEVEPQPEQPEDDLEVSLDSISRAVKDLRSGRSVDDSRMKEELRAYFDRLEPTEREALYAFLKSFGGILTGVYPGSEAPDPSDPPYNISMNHGGSDESEETAEPSSDKQDTAPVEQDFEEDEEEIEPADSPPIKAGSEQNLSEIRKRVRSLMHLS
tara:strand:+ start:3376 stop:4065 length:690 start_codon:yes stop_codon:yes gene_type:complete